MKKKIIGSSILLVALLLGLSTTCYADSHHVWNNIEIKNILYRYWRVYNNKTEEQAIQLVNDVENKITQFVTDINNRECIIIKNTSGNLYLVCLTNTIIPYLRSGNRLSFNTYNSDCYYYLCNNSGLNLDKRTNLSDLSSFAYNNDYIYTSMNIRSGSTTGSVLWSAGYYNPSTFFDEWYYHDVPPFSFIPETGLGIVSYNNYDYNLYEAPSSGDLLLGTLNIPNGIVVNYQDIINYYWRWNNWQERSLPSDIIKLRLLSSEEGNLSWAVYLKNDNIYNNTYYQYIWTSTQTEPYQFVSGGCYIKDSHTVIVDGVVDPYLTFSGDYSDEYNNNLEFQDLKDTMQDQTDQLLDSSEVDSLLGKFGSSGDILKQFGYSPIENPFVVVIRNVFIGLNDVLLGSGNQTLDLSSFGMELVLHSDDFILPDNTIINFIHLICNGFFVYGLYKYGFQLIQWINTGRLQNLLDETTGHTHYLF